MKKKILKWQGRMAYIDRSLLADQGIDIDGPVPIFELRGMYYRIVRRNESHLVCRVLEDVEAKEEQSGFKWEYQIIANMGGGES